MVITITKIGYDGNGDDSSGDASSGDDANAMVDDVSGNMVHTFTILDDDDPPVAYFYEASSSVADFTETQEVDEKDATLSIAGIKTIDKLRRHVPEARRRQPDELRRVKGAAGGRLDDKDGGAEVRRVE